MTFQMFKRVKSHPNFSAADYAYLSAKGYTDRQVLSIWNRDRASGKKAQMWTHPVAQMKLADTLRAA